MRLPQPGLNWHAAVVAAIALALAGAAAARAPEVWRCQEGGRVVYAQQECAGGTALDVADARTAEQAAHAREIAQRERAMVTRQEAERRRAEARPVSVAVGVGVGVGIGAGRSPLPHDANGSLKSAARQKKLRDLQSGVTGSETARARPGSGPDTDLARAAQRDAAARRTQGGAAGHGDTPAPARTAVKPVRPAA